MKENKKRVAITLYVENDFANTLNRKYAAEVLKGYNGTKQAFLNDCLRRGLSEGSE